MSSASLAEEDYDSDDQPPSWPDGYTPVDFSLVESTTRSRPASRVTYSSDPVSRTPYDFWSRFNQHTSALKTYRSQLSTIGKSLPRKPLPESSTWDDLLETLRSVYRDTTSCLSGSSLTYTVPKKSFASIKKTWDDGIATARELAGDFDPTVNTKKKVFVDTLNRTEKEISAIETLLDEYKVWDEEEG